MPFAIVVVEVPDYQALDEFCQGMDVVSVVLGGFSGFGFFRRPELSTTVKHLLDSGVQFGSYDHGWFHGSGSMRAPQNSPESTDEDEPAGR